MVNDILINTETDFNCWTAIHRLFITHKTPICCFFLSLIYNILKICTYCVSWRTNNKILSLHLLFSLFSPCFSRANIGVTYCYLHGRQHTNIQDIYAGHCNTAFNGNNKEYFSFFSCFFLYNETLFRPFEQSLRSSKRKSTLRSHISLCTHLIQTNYLFLMCIFWAVC